MPAGVSESLAAVRIARCSPSIFNGLLEYAMFNVLLSLIPSPQLFAQSTVPWGFVLFCAVVLAVLHLSLPRA